MSEPWPLPSSWEWRTFREVARVASDLVDPSLYPDAPHIAPNHIEAGTGHLMPYGTVSEDGVTSSKHRFKQGQLLYSKIRPYLAKVVIADVDGLCSADMYPIDTELEPRFLKWWMLTREFTRHAAGEQARTVLPKINRRALDTLPVPVPSREEQRRIVEVLEDHLSRLDAAEGVVGGVRKRLASLKRRALDMHFSVGALVPLADLLEDVSAGKSFGASNAPARADEWGIIKVSAMTWGKFRAEENKAVLHDRVDPRFEIRPGDLLVSRANTSDYVGASVLVDRVRPRLLLSDKSLRLTPREGVFKEWLWRVLQTPQSRRQISDLATGTKDSMRNISQASLLQVKVPSPSATEQAAAVESFETMNSQLDLLDVAAQRADARSAQLRHSLLVAAFSGRLIGGNADTPLTTGMMNA